MSLYRALSPRGQGAFARLAAQAAFMSTSGGIRLRGALVTEEQGQHGSPRVGTPHDRGAVMLSLPRGA